MLNYRLNKIFGKKVIHVEAPHLFGDELIEYCKKHKNITCYCITPTNYEYIFSHFGGEKDLNKLKEDFKRVYLELKSLGVNLQLHVHISQFKNTVTYQRKQELLVNAYNFFIRELEIVPNDIVFGWWVEDEERKDICKILQLKIIPNHYHIYDFWLNKKIK